MRITNITMNTEPLDGGTPIVAVQYDDGSENNKRLNPMAKEPVPVLVLKTVQDLVNDRLERLENGDEEAEDESVD